MGHTEHIESCLFCFAWVLGFNEEKPQWIADVVVAMGVCDSSVIFFVKGPRVEVHRLRVTDPAAFPGRLVAWRLASLCL